MKLENNDDLYEFLMGLAKELQAHGEAQLAKEVIFASRFAAVDLLLSIYTKHIMS